MLKPMVETFFINQQMIILKYTKTLNKSVLLKGMTIQQAIYQIILISKKSKEQALDSNPTAIKQTNFTGNLDLAANFIVFFILEEARETILDFSKRGVTIL